MPPVAPGALADRGTQVTASRTSRTSHPRLARPAAMTSWVTARRAVMPALLWGAGLGVYVSLQAIVYTSTYKTPIERAKLSTSLSGATALVGPGRDLQTAAGYTAWKCLMAVAVVTATWGLLTATRLVRGEEDEGRWEIMLAGAATRASAVRQAAAGLGAAVAAMLLALAAPVVATGRQHSVLIGGSAAAFFAITVVSAAAMFTAIGLLVSQLVPNRRLAAAMTGSILVASFLIRMVADSGSGVAWMRWASPLGWLEQMRPLTGSDPRPLLLVTALCTLCVIAAVRIAGRRDLGTAAWSGRTDARPRLRSLGSPFGLAARLVKGNGIAWLLGTSVFAAVIGSETTLAVRALSDSSVAQKTLARLGANGQLGRAYLGISFKLMTILVILVAINQLSAARREESSGRVDHLLCRRVSRARWLGGRMVLATAWAATTAIAIGVFFWASTIGQHLGVDWTSYMSAGVNTLPPALATLGLGLLMFGLRPAFTSAVAYGYLAWSFLVELVSGAFPKAWLLMDTSVLHHIAIAPARSPNWTTAGVMTAAGVLTAAAGIARFERRDLQSD